MEFTRTKELTTAFTEQLFVSVSFFFVFICTLLLEVNPSKVTFNCYFVSSQCINKDP